MKTKKNTTPVRTAPRTDSQYRAAEKTVFTAIGKYLADSNLAYYLDTMQAGNEPELADLFDAEQIISVFARYVQFLHETNYGGMEAFETAYRERLNKNGYVSHDSQKALASPTRVKLA